MARSRDAPLRQRPLQPLRCSDDPVAASSELGDSEARLSLPVPSSHRDACSLSPASTPFSASEVRASPSPGRSSYTLGATVTRWKTAAGGLLSLRALPHLRRLALCRLFCQKSCLFSAFLLVFWVLSPMGQGCSSSPVPSTHASPYGFCLFFFVLLAAKAQALRYLAASTGDDATRALTTTLSNDPASILCAVCGSSEARWLTRATRCARRSCPAFAEKECLPRAPRRRGWRSGLLRVLWMASAVHAATQETWLARARVFERASESGRVGGGVSWQQPRCSPHAFLVSSPLARFSSSSARSFSAEAARPFLSLAPRCASRRAQGGAGRRLPALFLSAGSGAPPFRLPRGLAVCARRERGLQRFRPGYGAVGFAGAASVGVSSTSSLGMVRVVMPIIPTPESLCPPRAPTVYEELLRRANVEDVNYLTTLREKADEILPILFDIAKEQGREISPAMTFKPQQFEQLKRLHEAYLRGELQDQLQREKENDTERVAGQEFLSGPEPAVDPPESLEDARLARIVAKHAGKQKTRQVIPVHRAPVPPAFHLIDDLYGPIYDKKVLLKQVHYFLKQGNYEAVRKVIRENRFVLCIEDAKKLLQFAATVIEEKEKAVLQQRIEATWNAYRGALPESFSDQDAQDIQAQLDRLSSSGPGPAGARDPEGGAEKETRAATLRDKRERQADRRKRREAEAAVKTQANLLKRLYEKTAAEIRGLQQEAGLRVRALYHSIHKALWEHGALKPYDKRPRKNQQRATVEVEDVSPYLKPPPDATRLERLEATEAFARAVNSEDWMEACKILRTKTRLLMFKSRHKLLAKFLELYQVVHAKSVKNYPPGRDRHDTGDAPTDSAGAQGGQEPAQGHDPGPAAETVQSEGEGSTEGRGDAGKRRRLTRREKNALRRNFKKPPVGGPYTDKQLNFFRKVWWTTLRRPQVVMKLMEPVAEWDDEEAKKLYRVQLAEYREKKRQENIQFWRDRGIDLTKYTMDFSDAKGLDWLRQKQAEGALDAPPPTLCKTKKELEEEKKVQERSKEATSEDNKQAGDETPVTPEDQSQQQETLSTE